MKIALFMIMCSGLANSYDEPHKLNADFNINRFISGDLVDEHGAAAVAH